MEETSRKRRMYILAEEQIIKVFRHLDASATTRPDSSYKDMLRYMAVTTLPYLDAANNTVQYGICCIGCQIALEKGLMGPGVNAGACILRDRIYSHSGFLEHFRQCGEAQTLWELSKKGTVPVKVPEFIRREGYFNERDVIMSFTK
ncbi:hypothetical protein B7463_g4461, partial [Scytalidium lignicola]